MDKKFLIALGNPGEKYAKTRHNAGAWFLDQLATSLNLTFSTNKSLKFQTSFYSQKNTYLIKSLSFMNLSGQVVRGIIDFYKISAKDIIVVHDDIDLELGKLRLKNGGGHGGHNGIRDIKKHLQNQDFMRLKIGLGRDENMSVESFVLGVPKLDEQIALDLAIEKLVKNIDLLLDEKQEKFRKKIV